MYILLVMMSIFGLVNNVTEVFKVQGAFYEIGVLLLSPNMLDKYYEKKNITEAQRNAQKGTFNVEKVKFSYPTKQDVQVLKGIDLDVQNNQIVALVGHSGCGKSSIISLIERFYDPVDGKLLFNDDDLQNLDMCWYHQQRLAIVQQEPALFSTNIRDNILYGFDRSNMTDEQVD